jgi:RNA polymerase sigma factor (sigma-70 family)
MVEEAFDYAACLERVRARDQAACRQLVTELYPQVIRIVRSHLPRRVAEEDLAQDIFLKMFTRLDQYQGNVPFPHWVSRIAVTTCIDQLRSQKRRPEFRWADLPEDQAEVLENITSDTRANTPGDALAARELVDRLLAQLKPDDQLVIRLLDLEQKSLAEISAQTGWNQTLIKVRAFRARRKLQKLFEELRKEERT